MFSVFREYKNIVTGVTLWGISDKYTWKDNFPVKGRKDWPLLFDEKGNPKPLLNKVINF
jgi:endo-1,4-beta-xylanase